MKLAEIRKKMAFNDCFTQTQKDATRCWFNSLSKNYTVGLTLTIKQTRLVKTDKGVFVRKADKDECKRIAKHFTQKLNQQVYGGLAKKYESKRLKYLVVLEGERSSKNLHLHMAIGNVPAFVKWNEINGLVEGAKARVDGLDEEHKVDIIDSGWMEYLTKELGMEDTDNVLWELA